MKDIIILGNMEMPLSDYQYFTIDRRDNVDRFSFDEQYL